MNTDNYYEHRDDEMVAEKQQFNTVQTKLASPKIPE